MSNLVDDVAQRFLDTPPIVEAVAGIEFRPRSLDVVRLVKEANRWVERYPTVVPQPPLDQSLPVGQPMLSIPIQIGVGVPPTRLWSISEDDRWLVQTQENRLVLNWRKVSSEDVYPNYDGAIRPEFERLLALLDRGDESDLVPQVAEFSYFNRIESSEPGLHEVYSIFKRPEHPLPGVPLVEQYQAVTQLETDWGPAQLTAVIQPVAPDSKQTQLTLTTKVFAGRVLDSSDVIRMVDDARTVSKQAFFAIVSESATQEWGGGR